ncbi:MAG: glycosyltransferase family 2 protein [Steroidobacteraceae bacterium]
MRERPAAGEDVCAVFVTYHPDADFPARSARIGAQVGSVLIIDNGSSDTQMFTAREPTGQSATRVICNGENLGVASALNIGIRRAQAEGYRFVLLLDQDTLVDPDMVDVLLAVYESCRDGPRVAAIGSRFRDTKGRTNPPIRLQAKGDDWQEVESVITSGCLLPVSAYADIGPFRDEFFIDHVDTEYCYRARARGYRIIETLRPLMSHTVGAPSAHAWFGGTIWTTNHSADRRYYMARNNTVLLREYSTSAKGSWRLKSIIRSLRLCKRILYFEQDKLRKIAAVSQGWWDGMNGKLGRRRESVDRQARP